MIRMNNRSGLLIAALAGVSLLALRGAADAQSPASRIMRQAKFDQRLGEKIPATATFRDATGQLRQLKEFLGRRPVVLALVYYECPMLCTLELNGLVRSLKALPMRLGRDFTVLTVSFDPGETPELAAKKKVSYLAQLDRPANSAGWRFLTGDQKNIDQLCSAVGFQAVYDPQRDEYAHASGLVVLTPEGTISRYFFGIDYPARDLRLGLTEASRGELGGLSDHLLLLCYAYDPATGKYGLVIMNVIRLGGIATVLLLGGFIAVSIYRDRRAAPADENDHPPTEA